jgi:hypothetical protein
LGFWLLDLLDEHEICKPEQLAKAFQNGDFSTKVFDLALAEETYSLSPLEPAGTALWRRMASTSRGVWAAGVSNVCIGISTGCFPGRGFTSIKSQLEARVSKSFAILSMGHQSTTQSITSSL